MSDMNLGKVLTVGPKPILKPLLAYVLKRVMSWNTPKTRKARIL